MRRSNPRRTYAKNGRGNLSSPSLLDGEDWNNERKRSNSLPRLLKRRKGFKSLPQLDITNLPQKNGVVPTLYIQPPSYTPQHAYTARRAVVNVDPQTAPQVMLSSDDDNQRLTAIDPYAVLPTPKINPFMTLRRQKFSSPNNSLLQNGVVANLYSPPPSHTSQQAYTSRRAAVDVDIQTEPQIMLKR